MAENIAGFLDKLMGTLGVPLTPATVKLVCELVEQRDSDLRTEALSDAAACVQRAAQAQGEAARSLRHQAIALKERGGDWETTFQAECLADAKRDALTDAAAELRRMFGVVL